MTDLTVPSHLPAGATGEGDGIMTGHGPVRVDAFIDFCARSAGGSSCRQGRRWLAWWPMGRSVSSTIP